MEAVADSQRSGPYQPAVFLEIRISRALIAFQKELFMKNGSQRRERSAGWKQQLSRTILYAAIPAGLFYCISALLLKKIFGFNIMQILREMAEQTEVSSFLGFMTAVGCWLWISAAAICIFGATTCKPEPARNREILILTALFSLILAIDDFFMIHDRYINQLICYFAYALAAGTLLLRHFKLIIQIDAPAFVLAGGLLALSILIDLIQFRIPLVYPITQAMEEGCKFVGGGVWLYFAGRAAAFTLFSPDTAAAQES
jgi:hypothetical protein